MIETWARAGVLDAFRQDMERRAGPQGVFDVECSPIPLDLFPDVYVARKATAFLERQEQVAPWFCCVSFPGPHPPWDAPEPYASLYEPMDMPPALAEIEEPFERPVGVLDTHPSRKFPTTEENVSGMRAAYAGKVALIDEQIGMLLDVIEARGELNDTVIVLTSDHGEMAGDCGLMHKSQFLNGAVRIPLVVSAPHLLLAAAGGVRSSAHVELMDVGAFMADVAGAGNQPMHYAMSFRKSVIDPAASHLAFSVSELKGELMYFDDNWKMAVNALGECYLLFDRRTDPMEARNLAGDPTFREVCAELSLKLFKHLVSTRTHV